MIEEKTWLLAQETASKFNENDLHWLEGLGITFTIEDAKVSNLYAIGQPPRMFLSQPPNIIIRTTTEKQETALFLKFGESIQLLQKIIYDEYE